jgi:hypothetical protein
LSFERGEPPGFAEESKLFLVADDQVLGKR